jgi:hypothetical protein
MYDPLILKVATRFQRLADQPPGQRQRAKELTQPINKPRGIDRGIVKDFAETKKGDGEDIMSAYKRDIQPKDVFSPTPDHTCVQNLVETGRGLEKAINKQIPKDKGYDDVRNLSQYLIWSEGGAEGKPVGKK